MTSAVDPSEVPSHRQERARAAEFDLVRYFSVTCLILFVIVTAIMCAGFFHLSKLYIRTDTEHHAVPVARWLADRAFQSGPEVPGPGTPERSRLDEQMRMFLEPLQIVKLKIYDLDRRIVYSTDRRIAYGTQDLGNAKLERALRGDIESSLQTDKSVWDLREEEHLRGAIVEAYVPVTNAAGQLIGVTEIYQDVTATYARLPLLILIIVIASVLAMGTLYLFLFAIIRRGSRLIRSQTQVIHDTNSQLAVYASRLEQLVEERTGQLRESLLQQQQQEKIAVAGTLAAGVAHELNTPLGTVLGSAQMVLDHCMRATDDSAGQEESSNGCVTCRQDLLRIEAQAKRCKTIIGTLVSFSHKSESARSTTNLAELIEQSVFLIQPYARQMEVSVEMKVADDLPDMLLTRNEIQQVLVNLMTNGIDAMTAGGILTIKAHRQGDTVLVQVQDQGIGLDETVSQRIFEPFYTSKEVGKGTGLGLSISYRIIQDHGGSIRVASEPGKGSTFAVVLPVQQASEAYENRVLDE